MGKNSRIEWTHHTFNPWWGCTKVSAACKHCYAEAWSKRVGQNVWGEKAKRRFFGEGHWSEPVKWNAEAEEAGTRHLLARCAAQGGEVVITDNDQREMDRFTMREAGECYVFDDDRVWHMLSPVEISQDSQFAFRDTVTFDLLPDGWKPS